jgi:catechol 2,3-dioxygenase-like lactoylglutathione lyase family enzyme
MWKEERAKPATGPRVDHVVVLGADLEKTARVYTGVLGLRRHPMTTGLSRDWMGMGHGLHAWIDGNGKRLWIEVIHRRRPRNRVLKRFGDGAVTELDAEVRYRCVLRPVEGEGHHADRGRSSTHFLRE